MDVTVLTINLVRKKLSSIIALPRAFFLDSRALAQLLILDQKLVEIQSFLDGLKMDLPDGFFLEVKWMVHRIEDLIEEVEYEMLHFTSEAFGVSSSDVAVSSPNELELHNNELDGKQSVANRKRKVTYTEYVEEIIGIADGIVGRAKGVLLVDLPSGSQNCKRGKVIHEGNMSNINGELSDQMHVPSTKQVTGMGSGPNVFPIVLTQKAEQLGNELDSLKEEFKRFQLLDISPDRIRSKKREGTVSNIFQRTFGRSKDVKNILRMLFSKSEGSRSEISVLAVTGMGGLGKTILAQLVYNHTKVHKHFDLMGWVFVSDSFDVFQLTRHIAECFAKKSCSLSELSSIQSELSHQVMGRSFFLVLDDVWNENSSLWETLMSPLRSAQFGRVIVTTRNMEVARIVQTMKTYSLGPLSNEDSLSLFKYYAFGDEATELHARRDDLMKIAEKIVKMCRGFPLGVKIIGSMLKHESDIEFWENIVDSKNVYMQLFRNVYAEDGYMPVLKISYDRLPPMLKMFFAIFMLYPKGYIFSKKNVTILWLALDFVEPENNQPPEVIADNYFEDLVQRNLIERNRYYDDTRGEGFIMHDLVHNLAETLAGKEFIRVDAGQQISLRNLGVRSEYCRYISIIVNDLPMSINLQPWLEYHQLRLLQIINKANKWNNHITVDLSDEQFKFLRHLRILDLRYTGIEALPSSVGKLKQLRYLNLTKTNISKLPESLSCLCYLKTLELGQCPLREIPQGITNLVNLQHLNFSDKNTCMPHGISRLTNLQTLPVFCIKRGSWHCEISELKGLIFLRGELTINGLRNVSSAKSAEKANLRSKNMLEVLTLDWSNAAEINCDHFKVFRLGTADYNLGKYDDSELRNIETVFENLQPNVRLKVLNIIDYPGSRFPNWFGDISFSHLSKISLNGCAENCRVLPTLGLLPSLKSLYISWMHNLQFIGREFCSPNSETKGFQSLETLEFKYIPNWVRWSGVEHGEFCRLNALRIVCCNELQFLPHTLSSSLTRLLIYNCKELSRLPFLPSLTRLTLSGELSESLLYNLQLPSLQFLKISCTDNITSLSVNGWMFPSLVVLVIKGCKYLQIIAGISSITSLKRLKIVRCRSVQISLSEEIPPSLQQMTIVRCHWLEEWHQFITIKYKEQVSLFFVNFSSYNRHLFCICC
jgi:NB-ARC domain/Leucine rich repeat